MNSMEETGMANSSMVERGNSSIIGQGQLYVEVQGEEPCVIYVPPVDTIIDEGLVELMGTERIADILSLTRIQRGSRPLLCYRIEEGDSVESVLRGRITLAQLRLIVGTVAQIWMELEQYLADPQQLVLDERFLFLSQERLWAVYLPLLPSAFGKDEDIMGKIKGKDEYCERKDGLRQWLRQLLPKIRLFDETAAHLLTILLQLAHGDEPLSAQRLAAAVREEDPKQSRTRAGGGDRQEGRRLVESHQERQEHREQKAEEMRRRCQEYFWPQEEEQELSERNCLKQRILTWFGQWFKNTDRKADRKAERKTKLSQRPERKTGRQENQKTGRQLPLSWSAQLEGGGSQETELLHRTELIGAEVVRLVRESTHECILLESFPCRLGKGSRGVNCQITGNEAISRCHIEIRRVEGGYEAVDLASTNGSYVNGDRLAAHRPRLLQADDILRLADEDFIFRQ